MPFSVTDRWNASWKRGLGAVNAFAVRAVWQMGRGKKRVLDLGCGTGKDSLYFARKGHDVTALDFSHNALAWLEATAERRHLGNVRTVCGDLGKKLPFPDGAFDVVYAHLSVHYFDDAQTRKVFAEIRRVLRRGGLFFVKCKSTDDPLFGKGKNVGEDMYESGHLRHFFRKEYMEELLRKGFRIIRIRKASSSYLGKRSAFVEAVAAKILLKGKP